MLLPKSAVFFEKQNEIDILWVDHPPVNALNQPVRKAIIKGIEAAMRDDTVQALILMAKGKMFCAGADIREFGTPLQFETPLLLDIFRLLDQAAKPVIAAMHGIAFGGAVELALSAHYRIADASARFSLPEVKLGLIPGSGGTQRLTRLIGPEKALSMIVGGDSVTAHQALEDGLLDALIPGDLKAGAIAFARSVADIRPLPRTRDMTRKTSAVQNPQALFSDFRKQVETRWRGSDAPKACVDAVETATTQPFDEGMRIERALFMMLLNGSQSAARRYAFFAERRAAKIPEPSAGAPCHRIRRTGDVNAGTAMVPDINASKTRTCYSEHLLGLHFSRSSRQRSLLEIVSGENTDPATVSACFSLAKKIRAAPVVVKGESAGVRMAAQYRRACETLIADGVLPARVDRVLYDFGFSKGPFTPSDQLIVDFSIKKGYTPRDISDAEILHRCIYTIINEGAVVLGKKIAVRPSDLDVIWINGYGWPVYRGGPMFYADQIGLPHILSALKKLQIAYGDDFNPAPLLEKQVAEGKPFSALNL